MNLSLKYFNFITPIILLLTYYSAFQNGKPTCNNYLVNSFLYVLSVMCIFISSIHIEDTYGLLPDENRIGLFIIGIILFFFSIYTCIRSNNLILKHLCLLYIVVFLGLVFQDIYTQYDQELIKQTLIRTFIVVAVGIIFTYKYPHLLKTSWYKPLIYLSLFLVVLYIIDIVLLQNDHRMIYSYLFLFMYIGYLLYDTKFILVRGSQCRGNADYVEGTLDIFLDLIGIFNQLLSITDS